MTPIEDLVRQALAGTPTEVTTRDPLAALDRRVRRARRRLAAGAGVVAAAVAAAIVIPLAVLGAGHDAGKVSVYHPPTPKPSAPAGTTVLSSPGAVWVSADSDGHPWLLEQHPAIRDAYYVAQVGANGPGKGFIVQGPADYVVAGDNVIWVIGEGPGGSAPSRLSAIDTRTGKVATVTFGQDLSLATAVGDSLYVDVLDNSTSTDAIDRVDLDNGTIAITASVPVPAAGVIATSQHGHVWVQSSTGLVELVPTAGGVDKGVTVGWGGDVYGPTGADAMGSDSLWSFDGDRLIGLTPKSLLQGSSVAQGWRLNVAGKPSAVVTAADGGVYVAVPKASAFGKQAGLAPGIDYLSPQDVHGSGTSHTASLLGVGVIAMAADPSGGVDYVDEQGQLVRWDPTSGSAR